MVDLDLNATSTCLKMTSEELRRLKEEDTWGRKFREDWLVNT